MNKTTKIALIAALPFLWACQTEHDFRTPATEGDEAVFVIGPRKTRTMYANDQWDATTNQELYWGNYITGEDEYIRVFSGQAASKVGTYQVVLKTDPENEQGSPIAGDVVRKGTTAVQWGAQGTAHTFYAFYPADHVGETLGADGKTVSATISPGQSAKAYRAVVSNGDVYDGDGSLAKVLANNTKDIKNRTNIFCQPDMENAAMVARTDMSAEQYGQDVPLDFNVIADVLDITINGPVIPNQLGGNAAGQSRDYIQIRSVSVVHKDKKPIVGTFNLDMSTSTATNITNGSSTILMQLSEIDSQGNRYVPTLFARVQKNTGIDAATDVDHLRVRAFLAPGVVKNLNELQIHVSTDCGDYTQQLGDYTIDQVQKPNGTGTDADPTMVAGKIHRLKLGYFMERGKQFDYTKWMSQLDPNIYINELSIPGSWHSTDSKYQGSYTSIVDQYNKGIRAFETHATCTLLDPTLTNVTSGTPSMKTSHSNGDMQVNPEDENKKPSAGATRGVHRTVTYTATITTDITGTVSKANYKVTNSAGNDMLTGLTNLGNAILDTEFAFVEIGSPASNYVQQPKVGSTATATRTETKTITKTQTGTQTSWTGLAWGTVNWNPVSEPTQAEWDAAEVTSSTTTGYKYDTVKINSFEGGILWLIDELKNAKNSKIYTGGITPSTTINDVKGHFIIKINTNSSDGTNPNGTESDWGTAVIPALFSRWQSNEESKIGAIALKWGGPIAPDVTNPSLWWVYSEKDNVYELEKRQIAWGEYVTKSLDAYKNDAHNAWFEFSAGGYTGGENINATAERCQTLAKTMNPWLLGQVSNPKRQDCPFGLVYFNYVVGDEEKEGGDPYSSAQLVRTIINNNSVFELRRKEAKSVGDENNAYFNHNPGNPLNP